jgi:chorismate dehydratase
MSGRGAIRIGAVSYLNARPLVFGLEAAAREGRFELLYDVPSRLADRLAAGELHLALIPALEVARIPDVEIVPGICIASDGPAGSVFLWSRLSPARIGRLALDPESRTSNALARILLAEIWNAKPICEMGPEDARAALDRADAAVRMGDKALFEPAPDGLFAEDLGAAWRKLAGLPFVYAVWAAKRGVLDEGLSEILHRSKGEGTAAIERIAEEYRYRGRRDPDRARTYLRDCLRYELGARELRGLARFLRLAARHGLVSNTPDLPSLVPDSSAREAVGAEPWR